MIRRPFIINIKTNDFWLFDIALLPFQIRVYPDSLGFGYNCGRGFCACDGFALGRVILLWPFTGLKGSVTSFVFKHWLLSLVAVAILTGYFLRQET